MEAREDNEEESMRERERERERVSIRISGFYVFFLLIWCLKESL